MIAIDGCSGGLLGNCKFQLYLRVARIRTHGLDGFFQNIGEPEMGLFDLHLATQNPGHIEQIIYQALETICISVDDRQSPVKFGGGHNAVLHHVNPANDGREWCPEFV